MVGTRSQSQGSDPVAALHHLRCSVFGETITSGTLLACFQDLGLNDIDDFLFLEYSDFTCAQVQEAHRPSPIVLRKLMQAQLWYKTHPSPNGVSTWFDLDIDTLVNFVRSGHSNTSSTPVTKPVTGIIASSSPSTVPDPVRDFQKSIKRDITHYEEFKDDTKWAEWHRHFTSMAATHGMDNVLSHTYVPETEIEKALFREQQKFLYSVFDRCLRTAKSIKFVRAHEKDKDAQALYLGLVEAYSKGISAELTEEHILDEIHKLRLTSSWTRPLEAFFTLFEHKVLDLESVRDQTVSETEKRKWLDAAIREHTELQEAVSMSKIVQQTTSGSTTSLSYDQYYNMLLSHAKVLDKQNKASRKANKANRDRHRTGFIPQEEWAKMTPEERIEHIENRREASTQEDFETDPGYDNEPLSTHEAQTNSSSSPTGDPPPSPLSQTSTTESPAAESFLRMVQAANRATQDTTQATKVPPGTKIVIDGQTFTANMARSYRVPRNEQVHPMKGSLIDGGCNGGIAGEDVRIIHVTDEAAKIKGIEDVELNSFPIVTAAGLIQSTVGPIIGIFHQYANYGKGNTIHSVSQIRMYGHKIDDIPKACGGQQSLFTRDGYTIPFAVRDGLCHRDMQPPTDHELSILPHVIMTSDFPWDPGSLNSEPNTEDCSYGITIEANSLSLDGEETATEK